MAHPIKPDEVVSAKEESLPDGVVDAFNELIVERWNGYSAVVLQREVVERILTKMPLCTRQTLYEKGWLDVEDVFRNAGWTVEYDKPGYNETYEANFTFKKP